AGITLQVDAVAIAVLEAGLAGDSALALGADISGRAHLAAVAAVGHVTLQVAAERDAAALAGAERGTAGAHQRALASLARLPLGAGHAARAAVPGVAGDVRAAIAAEHLWRHAGGQVGDWPRRRRAAAAAERQRKEDPHSRPDSRH